MQIITKEQKEGQVILSIEVSADEMKPYLDQAAAELSREVSTPGFRPGKAPYSVLEKQVGSMRLLQLAAEKAVQRTYPQAVVKQRLVTIGPPNISLEKVAPGNPLVYTAVVSLVPEVEIGEYKKISVKRRTITVDQPEVDSAVENVRRMFAKEKKVLRSAKAGDKVEIDMKAYKDSVPLEGGAAKNQALTIGESNFIPGFEDQLIGLETGQQKEFKLTFPKKYHQKDLANREVEFKVKINNIFEIELPALDDAFAQQAGKFKTLGELRKQIQENIKAEKEQKETQRIELAIIDELVKQSKFGPIPNILKQSELDKMLHELKHDVTHQGMKFDDYLRSIKKTVAELKKELELQAIKRVKTALLLRTIAEREQIEVSNEEINKELAGQRQQYQDNQEILKKIESSEYREYLQNMMRGRKVFTFLAKQVVDPK